MTSLPIIHRCAEPDCGALTYTARCPAHATPADVDVQRALDHAAVELITARERYQEACERVAVLEARAGIRRG